MGQTNILVVEDENIVALDLKNRLRIMGYTVVGWATTGENAIRLAEQHRPSLILMDIQLKGGMDGIQAAEQIRSRLNVPLIFLTAYSDEATLQRAKITEPYGYLLKPFEDRDLRTTIAMALYRHQVEQELREQRQWLATTLRSIGDAVIATDDQGRIKFMNLVAETLTGYSQEEALGRPAKEIFKVIHETTRLPAENPIQEVLATGVRADLVEGALLISRSGQEIPVDDSAAPIRSEDGPVEGVVLVFRDISTRRETEAQLRRYNEELKAHNAELDAYSHTVAHDLKTPLNSIIGFAELVGRYYPVLPTEVIENLEIIARNGRKMQNIIDELLLLAQVRKAGVKVQPLNMQKIVADVQRRLSYMVEEYQADIIVPEKWPVALGYAPWVEEVWTNYISNGLKYGGLPPRLELGAAVQPDGMVRFWLKDNGDGLRPVDQPRLFAPFTQLDEARAVGQGLGLSIVQRIVDKLGGQVGVESSGLPGQGSLFFFTLPGIDTARNHNHQQQPAESVTVTGLINM